MPRSNDTDRGVVEGLPQLAKRAAIFALCAWSLGGQDVPDVLLEDELHQHQVGRHMLALELGPFALGLV